jgi:hypothetical protein
VFPGARRGLMKKGDKVKVKGVGRGKVLRAAKDGTWYDIDFGIVVKRIPADEVKKRIF